MGVRTLKREMTGGQWCPSGSAAPVWLGGHKALRTIKRAKQISGCLSKANREKNTRCRLDMGSCSALLLLFCTCTLTLRNPANGITFHAVLASQQQRGLPDDDDMVVKLVKTDWSHRGVQALWGAAGH